MTNHPLRLSVLDIGPIRSNQTAPEAFASMISLAQHAESLNYGRYWLAEHHNVAEVIASHTPVFAMAVGARTQRIRIGGCVLLPHYAPALVAEQMAIVEACHPGRVDLGIGRSAGTDSITSALLGRNGNREPHMEAVQRLVEMLEPEGVGMQVGQHDYQFHATSRATSKPAVWLLGTSGYSAEMAAELGLPYAFGYHIQGEGIAEAIRLYRARFKPSTATPEPHVIVSIIAVVGDTQEEAELLARSQLFFMSAFRSGEKVGPQMLVEEAAKITFPDRYSELVAMFRKTWIIGDVTSAANRLRHLASTLGVQEFMINPVAAAYGADDPQVAPNRARTLTSLAHSVAL